MMMKTVTRMMKIMRRRQLLRLMNDDEEELGEEQDFDDDGSDLELDKYDSDTLQKALRRSRQVWPICKQHVRRST